MVSSLSSFKKLFFSHSHVSNNNNNNRVNQADNNNCSESLFRLPDDVIKQIFYDVGTPSVTARLSKRCRVITEWSFAFYDLEAYKEIIGKEKADAIIKNMPKGKKEHECQSKKFQLQALITNLKQRLRFAEYCHAKTVYDFQDSKDPIVKELKDVVDREKQQRLNLIKKCNNNLYDLDYFRYLEQYIKDINLINFCLLNQEFIVLPKSIVEKKSSNLGELANRIRAIFEQHSNLLAANIYNLKLLNLSVLPSEIKHFNNLSSIKLNHQVDSLPCEIDKLTQLKKLFIECDHSSKINCKGFSSFPSSISKLTNLKELEVEGTSLENLPPEIGNLVNLQKIRLTWTNVTSLPPEIGHLANLETLVIESSTFKDLPKEIGNLKKLKSLYLLSPSLTHLPDEIKNLPNLKKVITEKKALLDDSSEALREELKKKGVKVEKIKGQYNIKSMLL